MEVKIKVTNSSGSEKRVKFTLSLPEALCVEIDALASNANVSRHALIVAILQQAIADPKFVVELKRK